MLVLVVVVVVVVGWMAELVEAGIGLDSPPEYTPPEGMSSISVSRCSTTALRWKPKLQINVW